MQLTTDEELTRALSRLPGWSVEGGALVRTYTFKDFVDAMRFVNSAADLAEQMGHHPDLDIRYNRVKVAVTTHDADGITALDLEFASRLKII